MKIIKSFAFVLIVCCVVMPVMRGMKDRLRLLTDAVGRCDVHEVRRLLERDRRLVNEKDMWRGETVLYRVRCQDIAKVLLDHGADACARSCVDSTPLHAAAGCGATDVARLLLGCGADVNAQDRLGITPMRRLIDRGGGFDTELEKLLIERGADLELPDWRNRKVLHDAVTCFVRYPRDLDVGMRLGILRKLVGSTRAFLAAGAEFAQPKGRGRWATGW